VERLYRRADLGDRRFGKRKLAALVEEETFLFRQMLDREWE
jgi:hypothetical protein